MNSPEKIITRDDLKNILEDWQSGKLSATQVHDWAEARFGLDNFDYDDREGANQDSVAKEVLGALDLLDMKLVVPDDIPIYLEFLQTRRGSFGKGYQRYQAALKNINYQDRRKRLKDVPIYKPFCQGKKV